MGWSWKRIGAAVATGGLSEVARAARDGLKGPKIPKTIAPPPPSASVMYDDDGNVISSQVYDQGSNTWITKGRQYTPEEAAARKAEKAKLGQLRNTMLDNLNATPDDRQKAYDEYQQSYSDAAHRDIDPRFEKFARANDENMNARGLTGSRAYVDLTSELAKDKLATDQDIANQAVIAKEGLANNDRAYWANMLNQIDSGSRADSLAASQVSNNAANTGLQQYAGLLAQNNATNQQNMQRWGAKQQQHSSVINAITGTAGGLMYLYGGGAAGGLGKGAGAAKAGSLTIG